MQKHYIKNTKPFVIYLTSNIATSFPKTIISHVFLQLFNKYGIKKNKDNTSGPPFQGKHLKEPSVFAYMLP